MERVCGKNCRKLVKFYCECNGTRVYFCDTHVMSHLQDLSASHMITSVGIQGDNGKINELLKAVEKIKENVRSSRGKLVGIVTGYIREIEELYKVNDVVLEKLYRELSQMEDQLKEKILPNVDVLSEFEKWVFDHTDNIIRNNKEAVKVSIEKNSIKDLLKEFVYVKKLYVDRPVVEPRSVNKSKPTEPPKSQPAELPRSQPAELPRPQPAGFPRPKQIPGCQPAEPPRPKQRPGCQLINPCASNSTAASLLNRNSNANPKCDQGHLLEWDNLIPFEYYKQCPENAGLIWCNLCKKTYSQSAWHCSTCKYDLCKSCSRQKGLTTTKLACNNQHDLVWSPGVGQKYGNSHVSSGPLGFGCDLCHAIKGGSSWHCSECKYDVCPSCARAYGYMPPHETFTCPEGHGLSRIVAQSYRCSYCSIVSKGECYACLKCSKGVCLDCYEKARKADTPGHPSIRCNNDHWMIYCEKTNFNCDACLEGKAEERFRCIWCDCDICVDCADNYPRALKNGIQKCCVSGHQLKCTAARGNWNCDECRRGPFRKVGSFYCDLCDYDVCVNCMPKSS